MAENGYPLVDVVVDLWGRYVTPICC